MKLHKEKVLILIQARTGSTRLPNKVMMPLSGKPLLYRIYERIRRSKFADEVVVITSTDSTDKVIEDLCREEEIACFCGHPTDLLDRHYKAAKQFGGDVILKIPSDCPLIDFTVIDKVISFYLDNKDKYDYVSNLHPATYPDGNDVEVMRMEVLENAWENASKGLEREHTTPYFWEHPETFKIGNLLWETGNDYSKKHRWTIDYIEDYEFIKRVYESLYVSNPEFGITDILNLVENNPDIYKINSKYAGEYWYKNHVGELKTV